MGGGGRVMVLMGTVYGSKALGKAVSAETEPRSVAETNVLCTRH